jgi:hypothetical protein
MILLERHQREAQKHSKPAPKRHDVSFGFLAPHGKYGRTTKPWEEPGSLSNDKSNGCPSAQLCAELREALKCADVIRCCAQHWPCSVDRCAPASQ